METTRSQLEASQSNCTLSTLPSQQRMSTVAVFVQIGNDLHAFNKAALTLVHGPCARVGALVILFDDVRFAVSSSS